MISPIPAHQIFIFLLQFALLLALARLLGEMMKRYGQPPVFGELLAGILLGPSLLGWVAPPLSAFLFPPDPQQYHLLELISWLGMIFLLLFIGLEIDIAALRNLGRPALFASLLGIALPFTSGYALGSLIPDEFLVNPQQRLVFHLFMGTAMAISAVPVIAKILLDMELLKRNIGAIIMGAAVVDDICGWTLLSLLLGVIAKGAIDLPAVTRSIVSTVIFVTAALLLGIRLMRRLMRWINDRVQIEEAHITAVLVLTLVCAAITEGIGIHAVFGAFIAGVILSQSPRVRANALEKLAGVVYGVFTPVFFAFVGLRVDLTRLDELGLVGAVIAVACAGKLVGCTIGGLLGRLSWWEALAVGIGMNARGGMELIVALIGLTSGILGPELYGSLVIMAMVTSLMAPPLLTWALSHIAISEEERERLELANHRSFFDKRTLRILLPTAGGPNAAAAIRIAAPLVTSADAAITALFVHNDETTFPAQGFFSRLWRQPALEASTPLQPLLQLGQEYGIHIDTKIMNAEGKPAGDIILQEVKRGYDLLVLGASGYRHPLGGAYIDEVLAAAPTHVAIIKARDEKPKYEHLLVPTYGEGDARLAIEFAAMYAEEVGARVTLFHVLPLPEQPRWTFRRRYPPLDAAALRLMADTLAWQLRPRRTKPELQLTAKVVEEKRPETALLREIQSGGYDLLILSASLRGARPPHVLDPMVEHIVHEAPCTVIVLTPKHSHVGFPH
jgi:Kef-type K+ transport system membrane component KefB/nucleotide-binding universal stress UspA family protein